MSFLVILTNPNAECCCECKQRERRPLIGQLHLNRDFSAPQSPTPVFPLHPTTPASSRSSSRALSRCLARSVLSHQIHFISNQLQPLALMEGIKESSAAARLSRPTVAWTRRWKGGGMKGGMMVRWRLPGGWRHESPRWRTATGPRGSCAFLSFFFIFCSLVDIFLREEAGCEKAVKLQDDGPVLPYWMLWMKHLTACYN